MVSDSVQQTPAHAGDARARCGGEIHDPTLLPISAGAASGDPSHPTAALGGMFSGGGNQEIVPRRVPRACEGPGDSSELKAAVSELCTCVTNPPC